MKRGIWILATLLVLAAAGWWFGSPWWTLYRIKQAADARDMQALSAYIDYPALRSDMKAQIRAQLPRSVVEAPREVGALLTGALAEGLVDATVRPETIGAIFAAGSMVKRPPPIRAEDLEMRRDGLDQFRMVRKDGSPGEIVFRRHWLGWKLAGIHVPPDRIQLRF